MTSGWVRCEGSGEMQAVDWTATPDYPGASVCINCSYGVLLCRRSIVQGQSVSGWHGDFGRLRVHYVKRDEREPVGMTYSKPKGLTS